jgi:hypothetical protein
MTQQQHEPAQDALWGRLAQAWQGTATEEEQRRIEEAAAAASRQRVASFSRTIFWRNFRELAAAALVAVLGFGMAFQPGSWLGKAGGVSMALGALAVGAWIFRRGRDLPAPEVGAPTSVYLAHEAAQLEHQAQLLEQVRTRYLAPLLPGALLILAGGIEGAHRRGAFSGEQAAATWQALILRVAVFVLVFVGVDWLNRRAARVLRKKRQTLGEDAAIHPETP